MDSSEPIEQQSYQIYCQVLVIFQS